MLRSSLMTLVLTIFVSLGLLSQAWAHPMPTQAGIATAQALQALEAAGLPASDICGQLPGKTACPDHGCPICTAASALPRAALLEPVPVFAIFNRIVVLPHDRALPTVRLLLGHDAQGPPARLI